MRGFLAVYTDFSVFTEVTLQAYSIALRLSTSKRHFLCFISFAEDLPALSQYAHVHWLLSLRSSSAVIHKTRFYGVDRG